MVYFHSFNSTCKCTVAWDENFKRTTALIFHWKVCDFENGRTVLGTAGLRFRLVAGAAAPERAAWGRRFSPWCPAHLQTPALFPPKPVRNASTHDTQKPSPGLSSDLPFCTTRLCAQPPLANSSRGLPSGGSCPDGLRLRLLHVSAPGRPHRKDSSPRREPPAREGRTVPPPLHTEQETALVPPSAWLLRRSKRPWSRRRAPRFCLSLSGLTGLWSSSNCVT